MGGTCHRRFVKKEHDSQSVLLSSFMYKPVSLASSSHSTRSFQSAYILHRMCKQENGLSGGSSQRILDVQMIWNSSVEASQGILLNVQQQ